MVQSQKRPPEVPCRGTAGETEHTLLWRSVIRSQPDRWRHHWCRCFDWLLFCDAVSDVKVMKHRISCVSRFSLLVFGSKTWVRCVPRDKYRGGCRYDARKVHLLVWLINKNATKAYKGAEVYIQALITLELRGGQWVAPLSAPYYRGNSHRYPLVRNLSGPQIWQNVRTLKSPHHQNTRKLKSAPYS